MCGLNFQIACCNGINLVPWGWDNTKLNMLESSYLSYGIETGPK